MMNNTRIENDSMGALEVPEQALYAAQTQRAVNNFPISGQQMPKAFIQALLLAKYSAAKANSKLAQIPAEMGAAICQSVDELLGQDYMQHFPVDVFSNRLRYQLQYECQRSIVFTCHKKLR